MADSLSAPSAPAPRTPSASSDERTSGVIERLPLQASIDDARAAAEIARRRAQRVAQVADPVHADDTLAAFTGSDHYNRRELAALVGRRLDPADQERVQTAEPAELVELLGAAGFSPATTVAVLAAEQVDATTVAGLLPTVGVPMADAIRVLHERWDLPRTDAAERLGATATEMRDAGCTPVEIMSTRPRDVLRTLPDDAHMWELAAGTMATGGHPTTTVARHLVAHAPSADAFAAGLTAIAEPADGLVTAARANALGDQLARRIGELRALPRRDRPHPRRRHRPDRRPRHHHRPLRRRPGRRGHHRVRDRDSSGGHRHMARPDTGRRRLSPPFRDRAGHRRPPRHAPTPRRAGRDRPGTRARHAHRPPRTQPGAEPMTTHWLATPDDGADGEDLAEGGTWLLDLVAAVDHLRRGHRPGFTVWDAIEEALRWSLPSGDSETMPSAAPDPLHDALHRFVTSEGPTAERLQAAVRRWVVAMADRFNDGHHWPHPTARRGFPPPLPSVEGPDGYE